VLHFSLLIHGSHHDPLGRRPISNIEEVSKKYQRSIYTRGIAVNRKYVMKSNSGSTYRKYLLFRKTQTSSFRGVSVTILFDFTSIVQGLPLHQKHRNFLFDGHAKIDSIEF
jgi:hypothetical protein